MFHSNISVRFFFFFTTRTILPVTLQEKITLNSKGQNEFKFTFHYKKFVTNRNHNYLPQISIRWVYRGGGLQSLTRGSLFLCFSERLHAVVFAWELMFLYDYYFKNNSLGKVFKSTLNNITTLYIIFILAIFSNVFFYICSHCIANSIALT